MTARRSGDDTPVVSLVSWLVLALVIEKASYGYEIGARYRRRFGFFLPRNKLYGVDPVWWTG